jgi:hypothetical protein
MLEPFIKISWKNWLKLDKNTGHISEDLHTFPTVTLWIHPGWKII